LSLRLLEFGERLRVVHELRRRLDRADLGARVGDPEQHRLLLAGKTLYRLDEIGNEITAPLVLIHHLGPGSLDLLVAGLHGVVTATAREKRCSNCQQCHKSLDHGCSPLGKVTGGALSVTLSSYVGASAPLCKSRIALTAKHKSSQALALSGRLRSR